jgi:hypothetical protein
MQSLFDLRQPISNGETVPILLGRYGDYELFEHFIYMLHKLLAPKISKDKIFDILMSMHDKRGFNLLSAAAAAGNYKFMEKLHNNFYIKPSELNSIIPGTEHTISVLFENINENATLLTRRSDLSLNFAEEDFYNYRFIVTKEDIPRNTEDIATVSVGLDSTKMICHHLNNARVWEFVGNMDHFKKLLSNLFKRCGKKIESFAFLGEWLEAFPLEINEMKDLKKVLIKSVYKIDRKITNYKNLIEFSVPWCYAYTLPKELAELPKIKKVSLKNSEIVVLHKKFADLELILPDGKHYVPENFKSFEAAEKSLWESGILLCAKEMDNLTKNDKEDIVKLREVYDNTELNLWHGELHMLKLIRSEYFVDSSIVKEFASRIKKITLNWNANQTDIINSLDFWQNLEELELVGMDVTSLFDLLDLFPNKDKLLKIKRLTIRECKELNNIDLIKKMTNLEELVLIDNEQLRLLPHDMSSIKKLWRVRCENMPLKNLATLGTLPNLTHLELTGTPVCIPGELARSKIKFMDLSNSVTPVFISKDFYKKTEG